MASVQIYLPGFCFVHSEFAMFLNTSTLRNSGHSSTRNIVVPPCSNHCPWSVTQQERRNTVLGDTEARQWGEASEPTGKCRSTSEVSTTERRDKSPAVQFGVQQSQICGVWLHSLPRCDLVANKRVHQPPCASKCSLGLLFASFVGAGRCLELCSLR